MPVETSVVFLKTETLKSGSRPLNAFLMETSHVDRFPDGAGKEGEGEAHKAACPFDVQEHALVRMHLAFN